MSSVLVNLVSLRGSESRKHKCEVQMYEFHLICVVNLASLSGYVSRKHKFEIQMYEFCSCESCESQRE